MNLRSILYFKKMFTLIIICVIMLLPASVLSCAATATVSTPTTTPAAACTTCANVQVLMLADAGLINPPVTQTAGTNAAGCKTITVSCTSPVGTNTFLFWQEDNNDRGISTDDAPTVSRVLTCNSDAELILTEPTGSGVVDTVECQAAAA